MPNFARARLEQPLAMSYHGYRPDQGWSPAVNLYECKDSYWVIFDLAGLSADEIDINIEGGKMTISGHRPAPEMCRVDGDVCLHLMEIEHGTFVRALDMPDDVDLGAIEASYRSGYLSIRIPKST